MHVSTGCNGPKRKRIERAQWRKSNNRSQTIYCAVIAYAKRSDQDKVPGIKEDILFYFLRHVRFYIILLFLHWQPCDFGCKKDDYIVAGMIDLAGVSTEFTEKAMHLKNHAIGWWRDDRSCLDLESRLKFVGSMLKINSKGRSILWWNDSGIYMYLLPKKCM